MITRLNKFGRGIIDINGTSIQYFRVRVLNNESNINIFNKYQIDYRFTTALKKYKHNAEKQLQSCLEINLIGADPKVFATQELNIYRALREVAMAKVVDKYSFILDLTTKQLNTQCL